MIKEFQQFALFGKTAFVKAIIEPPFRMAAERSDFVDLAHFSKSFQKSYGSSPSDFRLD